MRNLKKVLSLALALVMMFALVIPATAVDASKDFPDWDEITNKEAVSLLAALDIVQGKQDGEFHGEDGLTRAEVAKMIYVARTGGVDDKAVMFAGIGTFTDTGTHWADGYINYCEANKLVSGRGDGKYYPDDKITGYEVMKICLTALNYNSDIEGFTGLNWKSNVAARAREFGLVVNYTGNGSEDISRDDTALIFANMIYMYTARYDANNVLTQADDAKTFGTRYLGLSEIRGVLYSNGVFYLGGTPRENEIVINVRYDDRFDGSYSSTAWTNSDYYGIQTFKPGTGFSVDEEYLGYDVTMLVRANTKGDISKVFAVTKTVGRNNDISSTGTSTDGLKNETPYYDLTYSAANIKGSLAAYYVNYDKVNTYSDFRVAAGLSAGTGNTSDNFYSYKEDGYAVKFIDNTGDGRFDLARIINIKFSAINTVYSDGSVNIGGTKVAKSKIVGEVPVKDDRVAYYYVEANDKYYVEILEPVNGKADKAVVTDTSGTRYIVFDGKNYYEPSDDSLVSGYTNVVGINASYLSVNGTYWMFKDRYYVDMIGEAIPDKYALVLAADTAGLGSAKVVHALLSGESSKVSQDYYLSANSYGSTAAEWVDLVNAVGTRTTVAGYNIYKYSLTSTGQLKLENPTLRAERDDDNTGVGGTSAKTVYSKGSNYLDMDEVYTNGVQTSTNVRVLIDTASVAFIQTATGSWTYYIGIGTIPGINIQASSSGTVDAVLKTYADSTRFGIGAMSIPNPYAQSGIADTKYYVVVSDVRENVDADGVRTYTFEAFDGTSVTTYVSNDWVGKNCIYTFIFTGANTVMVANSIDAAKTTAASTDGYKNEAVYGYVTHAADRNYGEIRVTNGYMNSAVTYDAVTGAPIYNYTVSGAEENIFYYKTSGVKVYVIDGTNGADSHAGSISDIYTIDYDNDYRVLNNNERLGGATEPNTFTDTAYGVSDYINSNAVGALKFDTTLVLEKESVNGKDTTVVAAVIVYRNAPYGLSVPVNVATGDLGTVRTQDDPNYRQ